MIKAQTPLRRFVVQQIYNKSCGFFVNNLRPTQQARRLVGTTRRRRLFLQRVSIACYAEL